MGEEARMARKRGSFEVGRHTLTWLTPPSALFLCRKEGPQSANNFIGRKKCKKGKDEGHKNAIGRHLPNPNRTKFGN
ncbi:unnamed protein product [Sphenostylis stenocarpa]|uniref:Uncharacterized protein n=1 Tax=Sphenostylis stenocarpa TaxID=92480 RepID=A0AA86SMD4_9FABA|nr:unnamed protein product [Sphenostylis stenocarpa]